MFEAVYDVFCVMSDLGPYSNDHYRMHEVCRLSQRVLQIEKLTGQT